MKNKNYASGQTIIEAIVALAALLIIITAISIVVVSGIVNSQFVRNQSLANKYAQQSLELVHNIQVNDPSRFASFDGTFCIDETTNPPVINQVNCSNVNVKGTFIRTLYFSKGDNSIAVAPCAINQTRIQVTVAWTSNKCPTVGNRFCHKADHISCFDNATQITTP